MMVDVVCMSLGSVPPGEQRSRFLAVGLSDQTVRIISLDPSVGREEEGGGRKGGGWRKGGREEGRREDGGGREE